MSWTQPLAYCGSVELSALELNENFAEPKFQRGLGMGSDMVRRYCRIPGKNSCLPFASYHGVSLNEMLAASRRVGFFVILSE